MIKVPKNLVRIAAVLTASLIVCLVVVDRAWDPRWLGHLRIDPLVYDARASFFLDNGSWENLGFNEYQPGALWYFVLVGFLQEPLSHLMSMAGYPSRSPSDMFLAAFMTVNCIVLTLHALLSYRLGFRGPAVTLLLALTMGPILLYRFELVTALVVACAWMLWTRSRIFLASLAMGIAVSVKIYPLLFAPLMLVSALRLRCARKIAVIAVGWVVGASLAPLAFLSTGGSLEGVSNSIKYHLDKPVGIDGLPGSIIPLAQELANQPVRTDARNGIFGIHADIASPIKHSVLWMWVPIVLVSMVWVLWMSRASFAPDPSLLFVLVGLFVGTGKLMAPQYAWWAASFLPLCSPLFFSSRKLFAVVIPVVFSMYLAQLVYPLHYTELLESFSDGTHLASPIFWVNVAKNLLWLSSVALCAYMVAMVSTSPSTGSSQTQSPPARAR